MKELTYEELEALEKAGFPVKKNLVAITKDYSDVVDIIPPTTDELIEELGEDIDAVGRITLSSDLMWMAFKSVEIGSPEGIGKTPKQALCNLYLALHKK